ncbi:MAG: hypothetical protein ACSLE4_11440 [Methyloceanibacter sp.]|uniref:hypothetical protein n=1 Tax=Methyloceanibacter sp. TaxID=1965321 RepID=UPI003EE3BE47
MKPVIRKAAPILLATVALVGLFMVTPSQKVEASPFDTLLGTWRGSGKVQLNSGMERLTCNAYYTGGGSQLGMAIRCKSESSNVEIRSKLSLSGTRITGNWEERTYNASGSASGTAKPGRISINVSGSIRGSMVVNYSSSRQSVSISTSGSPLQKVSINLTRS